MGKVQVRNNEYDLIVLGSGAAGFSAAVTAAHKGLKVLLIEKDKDLGGTTAWAGGWIWSPRNLYATARGIQESPEDVRSYLKGVLGEYYDGKRADAFIKGAPEMIGFFAGNTSLQFEGDLGIPDTYGHIDGAGTGGRSAIAKPFDAKLLGRTFKHLKKPLNETTFYGLLIQSGPDLKAFMSMTRSLSSFMHVTKRMIRFGFDLLRFGRSTDLRNGNALIGRLMKSALDLGVEMRCSTTVTKLLTENGRVTGIETNEGLVHSKRGVVLATGGFPNDRSTRSELLPRDSEHRTLATPAACGDGLRLAQSVGGKFNTAVASPAAYCPVSLVPWSKTKTGVFPHIIDRGKPGLIAVRANGKRFCNEGLGYHDFVVDLQNACADDEPAKAWMICDHRFLRRFGLGIVRPTPVPFRHWIKNGYLKTGKSVAELAEACGIDTAGLQSTIETWNSGARKGEDTEFGRGTTPYMRLQGDAEYQPNPCVAPIEQGPFYAVEVVPGSFGTFAGIAVDERCRVLNEQSQPIDGLYAAGTDAVSVFGGFYPAGGIAIGPALTFGYLAALDAAGDNR